MPRLKEGGFSLSTPIVYLSRPAPVSMSDWYYGLGGLDHFWTRRRFDVLARIGGKLLSNAGPCADIGCGAGVLQRQIEDRYRLSVTGFELNEIALRNNMSRISPLYCYDIHQRDEKFAAKFDIVLLFDVLEHIKEDVPFLESVKYHMSETGVLVVNVPAHQILYSAYDRAAGHYRRYSIGQLKRVASLSGLTIRSWTYWGLPMVPLVATRKIFAATQKTEQEVYNSGFNPPGGRIGNQLLFRLAGCERIPQKFGGTSAMAILVKSGRG